MEFLVTTSIDRVNSARQGRRVFMLDGTVPGYVPAEGDIHFDHHRVGGAKTQIAEMVSLSHGHKPTDNNLIITTQVDADACVAAAFLLLESVGKEDYRRLEAIAYDCDHLHVPSDGHLAQYAEFAAKAVADLKQQGFKIADELGLPKDRKTWTAEQKEQYASLGFQRGTEWLVDAAKGDRPWPGTSPDAEKYWEDVEAMTQKLIDENRIWLSESGYSAIYSLKGIGGYVDPRCANRAIAQMGINPSTPVVLKLGDFRGETGGNSYTLGSNPMHPDAESLDYSSAGVWLALTIAEAEKRDIPESLVREHWDEIKGAKPTFEAACGFSAWGGRDKVGGSGWNTPSALASSHVCQIVEESLGMCVYVVVEEFENWHGYEYLGSGATVHGVFRERKKAEECLRLLPPKGENCYGNSYVEKVQLT